MKFTGFDCENTWCGTTGNIQSSEKRTGHWINISRQSKLRSSTELRNHLRRSLEGDRLNFRLRSLIERAVPRTLAQRPRVIGSVLVCQRLDVSLTKVYLSLQQVSLMVVPTTQAMLEIPTTQASLMTPITQVSLPILTTHDRWKSDKAVEPLEITFNYRIRKMMDTIVTEKGLRR
jgi:hypothetical protein